MTFWQGAALGLAAGFTIGFAAGVAFLGWALPWWLRRREPEGDE